jgi:hypothetical protein
MFSNPLNIFISETEQFYLIFSFNGIVFPFFVKFTVLGTWNILFLFCTYNTVSITLKRISKRSSFRYAFQEHLLKFLMLAVIHSELLLHDHCNSRHFKFKTYNCSSIYQRYQVLYLPNIIFLALCFELFLILRGKIEKILYFTRFISHFVALVCFIALVAAL